MSKYRIMVVDDSRVICAEMKKMLEGSDIEIIGYCRSGEEALEQYGTMKPDLVTLDIVMPGMDGLETCKKLREHYPEANIFMVSSMAYDDMIDRAAALGAKGFLLSLIHILVLQARPNFAARSRLKSAEPPVRSANTETPF